MGFANWVELGRMDALGRMDTPVHRLDARAKAVVTLAYIAVVMSFPPRTLAALTPFALYPVVLLAAGRIPVGAVAGKLLVAAPFAVAVALFNPLLDRAPALALGPVVLSAGWVSFASVLARFVLTVGAALTLVACTGMHRLAAGLEGLGVPRVFVVQLLFLYRYLFVVTGEAARTARAAGLRSAGVRTLPLRAYGPLLGHLLLRSMDRAGRIHRAMVARGFDGGLRGPGEGRFGWNDAAFTGGWLAYFAVARTWDLAALLGRLPLERWS